MRNADRRVENTHEVLGEVKRLNSYAIKNKANGEYCGQRFYITTDEGDTFVFNVNRDILNDIPEIIKAVANGREDV